GRVQFDPLSRPILRVRTARGVANGVEVRCVQWQRLGNVLEVKNDLLRFFAVQAFERFVPCALNRDDARFPFQVSGLQVFAREYFISSHVEVLSSRLLPLGNAKVRGSVGLSKLDCAPDGAPVGACHNDPEHVAFCRWPWTAVRAVAGDGAYNDHRRFSGPCRRPRRAARPWRPPPMLAPGELAAENPLVVGNPIARGGAFV